MAGEAIISVIGNAGSDAELRKTPSGTTVTSFSLANTPRTLDKTTKEWKDLETIWYRCFVWGKDATGAANEIRKGTRVFINGRFITESFTDKDGKERKVLVINALREKPHDSHLNISEALELINYLQPEKTYFTHISHLMGFHKEVEEKLPRNVHLAYDTLKITI